MQYIDHEIQNVQDIEVTKLNTTLSELQSNLEVLNKYKIFEDNEFNYNTSLDSLSISESNIQEIEYCPKPVDTEQLLIDNFGFSPEIAKLICKLQEGINNMPNISQKRKDELFNRTVGGFRYDEGVVGVGWKFLFGLALSDKDIIEFGILTEEELAELNYGVRLQNKFVSGTIIKLDLSKIDTIGSNEFVYFKTYCTAYGIDDENATLEQKELFITQFNEKLANAKGKNDFSHQSVTTGAQFTPQSNLVKELAGWRGDSTHSEVGASSMGEDDYKSDLDAVNISFMMETQGISFEQANQSYYQQISNKPSLRDEMFIDNNGGIDSMIKEIFDCSLKCFAPDEKEYDTNEKN